MRTSQRRRLIWCAALAAITGCATHQPARLPAAFPGASQVPVTFWSESFDQLDLQRWREVNVKRRTQYRVVDVDGRRCLQAQSRNGASILLALVSFDPADAAWLSWEWRVDQLVQGEALNHKRGADAAARVYVYFGTDGMPWQKRSLDYVWSATLPAGTVLESPYSSLSKVIVVESGSAGLGTWRRVERNLRADYRRCFMAEPPQAVAIGVMSDTDNTHSEALAYFDNLRLSRNPLVPGAGPRPADWLQLMKDE